MQVEVLAHLRNMVAQQVATEDLRELLDTFIREKVQEGSRWADIAACCHRMLGGNSPLLNRIGAVAEAVLLALDIVDDLQDQDNTAKPWVLCPAGFALNAVLALLFASMQELSALRRELPAAGDEATFAPVEAFLLHSVSGQQQDLNESVQTEADYLEMARAKSGALMKFVCYLGAAAVEGIDDATLRAVQELAEYAGIVAQISNDLRDVLRYDVKNDLLQKKRTLPILFLLDDTESANATIRNYYAGELTREQFLREKIATLRYIDDSGCVEYVMAVKALFADRAETLLSTIPLRSPWKEQFREMTFA